jgi:hypothetical protein
MQSQGDYHRDKKGNNIKTNEEKTGVYTSHTRMILRI